MPHCNFSGTFDYVLFSCGIQINRLQKSPDIVHKTFMRFSFVESIIESTYKKLSTQIAVVVTSFDYVSFSCGIQINRLQKSSDIVHKTFMHFSFVEFNIKSTYKRLSTQIAVDATSFAYVSFFCGIQINRLQKSFEIVHKTFMRFLFVPLSFCLSEPQRKLLITQRPLVPLSS